jgi:hypothetical protein
MVILFGTTIVESCRMVPPGWNTTPVPPPLERHALLIALVESVPPVVSAPYRRRSPGGKVVLSDIVPSEAVVG